MRPHAMRLQIIYVIVAVCSKLLENPKNPFEIPDSARQPRSHGIGALQPGQEGLGIQLAAPKGDLRSV